MDGWMDGGRGGDRVREISQSLRWLDMNPLFFSALCLISYACWCTNAHLREVAVPGETTPAIFFGPKGMRGEQSS